MTRSLRLIVFLVSIGLLLRVVACLEFECHDPPAVSSFVAEFATPPSGRWVVGFSCIQPNSHSRNVFRRRGAQSSFFEGGSLATARARPPSPGCQYP